MPIPVEDPIVDHDPYVALLTRLVVLEADQQHLRRRIRQLRLDLEAILAGQ